MRRWRPALEQLGDCDILRPLDHGGMGLVCLARQRPLGRLVVVKVIRPELRGSRTARERFRREAAAAPRKFPRRILGGVRSVRVEDRPAPCPCPARGRCGPETSVTP